MKKMVALLMAAVVFLVTATGCRVSNLNADPNTAENGQTLAKFIRTLEEYESANEEIRVTTGPIDLSEEEVAAFKEFMKIRPELMSSAFYSTFNHYRFIGGSFSHIIAMNAVKKSRETLFYEELARRNFEIPENVEKYCSKEISNIKEKCGDFGMYMGLRFNGYEQYLEEEFGILESCSYGNGVLTAYDIVDEYIRENGVFPYMDKPMCDFSKTSPTYYISTETLHIIEGSIPTKHEYDISDKPIECLKGAFKFDFIGKERQVEFVISYYDIDQDEISRLLRDKSKRYIDGIKFFMEAYEDYMAESKDNMGDYINDLSVTE